MIRETCVLVGGPDRQMNADTITVAFLVLTWAVSANAQDYDPLRVPDASKIETIDLVVHDSTRKREIPLRVYHAAKVEGQAAAPVVLFSHGLGGTRNGSAYLGNHWAKRGYV